ncbi:lysine biosynthesis protein LysW [Candidatus Roizmanbacteria bacterium CG10_big_fil_rev_8_21_14_0_10_39_6]|uniref:Lysine biosynthesis protein LysW n=1 Tax=Candidatus Roizmanbacteria bacterium CG10_big_fil_rev_8_21_14_0_10_39_6 TaxID=1974853 RepID=A0A2M8KR45_9BACT|nr:MAG: lysine biosynthesis protein LysW [Candidatus Roizmanbacteria bacterium CG10_big_fil_rev_8_21_14_0_10_39_6]
MNAQCPVCDGMVTIAPDTIESEIIQCPECSAHLVVERIEGSHAVLTEAPKVEEDWGE